MSDQPEDHHPSSADDVVSAPAFQINVSAASSEALSPDAEAEAHDATPVSPSLSHTVKQSQMQLVHEMQRERKKSMIISDNWVEVQERTFFRWCNYHLSKRKLSMDSLRTGLSDGVLLCQLVEILSKKTLPARANKMAKNQVVRLDNLRIAFNFLEGERGVHLVNVRPADIESGNLKIILGLVWGLIQKYQIMSFAQKAPPAINPNISVAIPASPTTPFTPLGAEESASSSTPAAAAPAVPSSPFAASANSSTNDSAKAELLRWVNTQVQPYAVGNALDFGRSFQDGKIISALVDSLDEHTKRELNLTGDAMSDVTTAIERAEKEFNIPPLMDAADIVSRPQEHSLMTYVSCLREYVATRTPSEPVPAPVSVEEKKMDIVVATPSPTSDSSNDSRGLATPDREVHEVPTLPLSPMRVIQVSEDQPAQLGAVEEEDTPPTEPVAEAAPAAPEQKEAEPEKPEQEEPTHHRLTSTPLSEAELAAMAERPRVGTHPSLVGAFIESESLEAALSPKPPSPVPEEAPKAAEPPAPEADPVVTITPAKEDTFDSEKQSEKDALEAPLDINRRTEKMELPGANAAASSSNNSNLVDADGPRPDPNAVDDYSKDDEPVDEEGKLPNETLQQSIDRRIEKMMNDIEICIVTPDHKYLQSDTNGVVRAHELNTASATWTIVEGAGGWKYLRDYQSRYLACDPDGRVYTCKRKKECRFRIIRGGVQYFEDSHGHYLAVHQGGLTVRAEEEKCPEAQFTICFPVVESILEKKGTSGLQRWQERYFAFNGSVCSYWRKQKAVGKERPSGIYHPSRMVSVNINRAVAKRFNIVFQDGKVVELRAPTVEESIRWVRALNSRGVRTVHQTKRMSVMPMGPGVAGQGINLLAGQNTAALLSSSNAGSSSSSSGSTLAVPGAAGAPPAIPPRRASVMTPQK